MHYCNRNAFTLIELIIVVIIVAILASIVSPMMRDMKLRAIAQEAIVTLGIIREAERQYRIEHNSYATSYEDLFGPLRTCYNAPGKRSALDGTYFSEDCYTFYLLGGIEVPTPDTFKIVMLSYVSDPSYAPKASEMINLVINSDPESGLGYIMMDEKGNIYSDIKLLGYPRHPSL